MLRQLVKMILPSSSLYGLLEFRYRLQNDSNYNLIKNNNRFKNIHNGRCFIIGNGPSINKINFADLAKEYTFSVNQLSRREDFQLLKTTYHVWMDEGFFDICEDRAEDMELLRIMEAVGSQEHQPEVFYRVSAVNMIKKYGLDKKLQISYIDDMSTQFLSPNIELRLDRVFPRFPTVIHYVIPMAVYMGFTEIYLLGCDCTGIINTINSRTRSVENMVYGYEVSDNERRRMERRNNQYSIQDELRWYAELFDVYKSLGQYCEQRNVKIYNATEGSLLDSIPKVRLEDVLAN